MVKPETAFTRLIRYSDDLGIDVFWGKGDQSLAISDPEIQLRKRKNVWHMVWILAHEIGHILLDRTTPRKLRDQFAFCRENTQLRLEEECQAWVIGEEVLENLVPGFYTEEYIKFKQKLLSSYYRCYFSVH
jgi:Zn-dependent peptidase ImmA (M78 family)